MWACPRCGAKLLRRGLSHSCGDHSVERFLEGKPRGRFDRFVKMIAACGPYDVAPAKTRVAFLKQVRFASVNRVAADCLDVHFVLPRRLASSRFRKVEKLGRLYVHHLRLRTADEFDRELQAWLRASYREYGDRGWLQS
jgi:hypothetical protein